MAYILLGPGQTPACFLQGIPPGAIARTPGLPQVGGSQTIQVYAGRAGLDGTQFYSDLCPNCNHVHVFYAAPAYSPATGRVQATVWCYAAGFDHATPITFNFAGWGVPASGPVLAAISQGAVISS